MEKKKIFLIAGELSGDLHGALLVRELKKINPDLRFYGLGGKAMEGEGVQTLFDLPSVAALGLGDVLRQYFLFRKIFHNALDAVFGKIKPDLIILIDYPGFNIRFAKKIKQRIPILYYISPQVWAWGKRRIKTIAKHVSKMLVFLPFEAAVYEGSGMPCEFVGHPLIDLVKPSKSPRELKDLWRLHGKKVISLLPGSRHHEVHRILPVMLQACGRIAQTFPDAIFLLAESRTLSPELYTEILKTSPVPIQRLRDETYNLLSVSDFALVTSGTATLETAISLTPFVLLYKADPLTYFLGKNLVRLPYLGLANVIAGEKIIPEFIQKDADPSKIADTALHLIQNEGARSKIIRDLEKVRKSLGAPGAVSRAAKAVLKLLETGNENP